METNLKRKRQSEDLQLNSKRTRLIQNNKLQSTSGVTQKVAQKFKIQTFNQLNQPNNKQQSTVQKSTQMITQKEAQKSKIQNFNQFIQQNNKLIQELKNYKIGRKQYNIHWKGIIGFINKINRLLKSCKLNDQETQNLELIMLFPVHPIKAVDEYCSLQQKKWINEILHDYIEEGEIPVCYFMLIEKKLTITIRSMIYTYVFVNRDSFKVGYGLHSKTFSQYENKGYNTFLRSIFILSSQYLYVNDKHIDLVGSHAVNPISKMIWTNKFHLKEKKHLNFPENKKCYIIFYFPNDPLIQNIPFKAFDYNQKEKHTKELSKYFNLSQLVDKIYNCALLLLTQNEQSDVLIQQLQIFLQSEPEKMKKIILQGIFKSENINLISSFHETHRNIIFYFFYVLFPKIAQKLNWIEGKDWAYIKKKVQITTQMILVNDEKKKKFKEENFNFFGPEYSNFTNAAFYSKELIDNAKKQLILSLKTKIGKCTNQQINTIDL